MRFGRAVGVIGFGLAVSTTAHAQFDGTYGPPPRGQAVEVGVGLQSALAFGDTCWSHGDVTDCTSGYFMNGVHLAPRWRFAPEFSVGALGSASWVTNIRFERHTFWSAELEGRWHPLGPDVFDPWFGVDGGVVAVVDDYTARAGELSDQSYTHTAPMLGVGAGMEFKLAPFLSFGIELRGFALMLEDGQTLAPGDGSHYATQYGAALSFSATFLLGEASPHGPP